MHKKMLLDSIFFEFCLDIWTSFSTFVAKNKGIGVYAGILF